MTNQKILDYLEQEGLTKEEYSAFMIWVKQTAKDLYRLEQTGDLFLAVGPDRGTELVLIGLKVLVMINQLMEDERENKSVLRGSESRDEAGGKSG